MVGVDLVKIFCPSFGASPRNVTVDRLAHSKKVRYPMLVTPSGIVMPVRLLQLRKAELPMLVSLLFVPKVMLVRPVQREKAELPMLVTLSGIVMLVRLVH